MVYYFQKMDKQRTLMVQENGQRTILEEAVLTILERLCLRHGSSWEGRRTAAACYLEITQKVPILLSEIHQDLLFPTRALRDPSCVWINYRAVDTVCKAGKETLIRFHDDSILLVQADVRCIRRSMCLCERYLAFLNT